MEMATGLGNSIDLTASEYYDTLLVIEGNKPQYLTSNVASDEYASVIKSGYMNPSKFYQRIHANRRLRLVTN